MERNFLCLELRRSVYSNFNANSKLYRTMLEWPSRRLPGMLPNVDTLSARGSVRPKVLNVEKIQLALRSSLTITIVETAKLELDIKKSVSAFTVNIYIYI